MDLVQIFSHSTPLASIGGGRFTHFGFFFRPLKPRIWQENKLHGRRSSNNKKRRSQLPPSELTGIRRSLNQPVAGRLPRDDHKVREVRCTLSDFLATRQPVLRRVIHPAGRDPLLEVVNQFWRFFLKNFGKFFRTLTLNSWTKVTVFTWSERFGVKILDRNREWEKQAVMTINRAQCGHFRWLFDGTYEPRSRINNKYSCAVLSWKCERRPSSPSSWG